MPEIEIWGGLECTVARIRDSYVDQTVLNGHEHRLDDLDRFAALGIRRIRYPVLWERVAPDGVCDWAWTDARMVRLRALGLAPIVTLLHHGSGPRHTGLLDPGFAAGLADFAARAAERYPWVEDWTPINEPLTTARFSGLYGHWYPHARDEAGFLRMLVHEVEAMRLAMAAIRRVNPAARFVHTEDLTRVHATPPAAPAAAFQNHRRWLGLDLLTGRVAPSHFFWPRLRAAGLAEAVERFAAAPCPPDVLGFNHYLSSERFLDHRVERYHPLPWTHDGSERHVDVEAASVLAEGAAGIESLLREAWERYRLPLAVTEVHTGSTRDEQLRWLYEIWRAAHRLAADGIDVRAVTAWALLGSYDWHRLLTHCVGYYEPGPFDVRSPTPRATALAGLVRAMAGGAEVDHPVLDAPGAWHRADRFLWRPVRACPFTPADRAPAWCKPPSEARRLLIVGSTGTLGRAFARVCARRALAYRLVGRSEMDIADAASVHAALVRHRPWAVINAAGYVRVDDAETDAGRCRRENADGPAVLAAACAERGIPLVGFSSDLVFDGAKGAPYVESDAPAPLNVYGKSKAAAERAITGLEHGLAIRTSAFFGPWDEHNFIAVALRCLGQGRPFRAAEDVTVSPTYVPDLVNTALDLLIDGERGVWHLANAGAVTWAGLAREAARRAGLDPALVEGVPAADLGWTARRPARSVLASERGRIMPALDDALGAHFALWHEEAVRQAPVPLPDAAE
ncbi:family 1 glycosylhydrolase [Azospirillum sp. TSO22-1]|uniref:family 1 glycosylhydrolase n=1 Tax=Azospirillum sp. TSO22-1 TaxID=716789 RepID=UPI000D6201C4|nr:family 1 glycosylhydrolase [Azospirillum sp. TSO22-1]PWC34980.1 dTDP-4-dehydrorhamnose reductase [Azospirillum sp. TSO22-1]